MGLELGFYSVLRNEAEEYGESNLPGACLTLDFPYANHFSTSRRGLALSPTCLIRGKVVSTQVGCGRNLAANITERRQPSEPN